MTTETTVLAGDIDSGSPLTVNLATAWTDNWKAGFEGNATSKILRKALTGGITDTWWFDYGDGSDGAANHTVSANIAGGIHNYTTFTIATAVTLTLNDYLPLIIRASTSITINGTGKITAKGMGAPSVSPSSTGTGANGNTGFMGGSAGGETTNGTLGGGVYNDTASASAGATQSTAVQDYLLAQMFVANMQSTTGQPLNGGASGGCWWATGSAPTSGAGGGIIILIAPTITINASATLDVSGNNGSQGGSASNGSGGGGGGAIIIAGATLSNSGTNTISGGTGQGTGSTNGGSGWYKAVTL